MLFILAQLCWLLFPQALRWYCCPQGDESFKLTPSLQESLACMVSSMLHVLLSAGTTTLP